MSRIFVRAASVIAAFSLILTPSTDVPAQSLPSPPPIAGLLVRTVGATRATRPPNPHPGKHPICHDPRLLGIWRRVGVDQQLVITENGESYETYDGPGMLPDSAEGGGGSDLIADGSRICENDLFTVAGDAGYRGEAIVDRDGLGMTVLTKEPHHPRIRYRRVVPLPSDPIAKRDYCAPDEYTLIVAQPGPRGVLLPHCYDVFSHGGQISLNGQRAAIDPRSNLGRGSHVNPPVLLGQERPAHAPSE